MTDAPTLHGTTPTASIVSLRPVQPVRQPRFFASGGDVFELSALGKTIPWDWNDAITKVVEWRFYAETRALDGRPEQSAEFDRQADDLEAAVDEARRWRRCAGGGVKLLDGPNEPRPAA